MSPVVSVVICTHNRVQNLRDAVDSILSQGVSEQFFELLVVDNASTDATREFVSTRAVRTPNLKYCLEPVIGLSRARNRGLTEAKGQYVAYIDDDAIADPGWLAHIPSAFEAGGSDVGCVAGKISPIWDAPRPAWLHDALLGYVTINDFSSAGCRLGENQYPYGANVIYRRDVLLQVGGFSPRLGRKGTSLLSNEEVLLDHSLKTLGYSTYYDPRVSVRHHVPAARLTKRWFKHRAYCQGVSDAILEGQLTQTPTRVLHMRRLRLLAWLARHPRQFLLSSKSSVDEATAFWLVCKALTKLGYATASIHAWRS